MQRQRENGQQGSVQEQTVLPDEDEEEEDEEDEESERQTPESTESGSIFYSSKRLPHAKSNKWIKVYLSIVSYFQIQAFAIITHEEHIHLCNLLECMK